MEGGGLFVLFVPFVSFQGGKQHPSLRNHVKGAKKTKKVIPPHGNCHSQPFAPSLTLCTPISRFAIFTVPILKPASFARS